MAGPNTPFRCDDNGDWTPFSWSRLEQAYGSSKQYAARFAAAVDRLVARRWVTKNDGERTRQDFYARMQ